MVFQKKCWAEKFSVEQNLAENLLGRNIFDKKCSANKKFGKICLGPEIFRPKLFSAEKKSAGNLTGAFCCAIIDARIISKVIERTG